MYPLCAAIVESCQYPQLSTPIREFGRRGFGRRGIQKERIQKEGIRKDGIRKEGIRQKLHCLLLSALYIKMRLYSP
jgi:hypothetical protein